VIEARNRFIQLRCFGGPRSWKWLTLLCSNVSAIRTPNGIGSSRNSASIRISQSSAFEGETRVLARRSDDPSKHGKLKFTSFLFLGYCLLDFNSGGGYPTYEMIGIM